MGVGLGFRLKGLGLSDYGLGHSRGLTVEVLGCCFMIGAWSVSQQKWHCRHALFF